MQVTLFAHSHRKSNWHSVYSLASNVHHARWDQVPGFAVMHQKGIWYEYFVRNTTRNIEGAMHNTSDPPCDQVSSAFTSLHMSVPVCRVIQFAAVPNKPSIVTMASHLLHAAASSLIQLSSAVCTTLFLWLNACGQSGHCTWSCHHK